MAGDTGMAGKVALLLWAQTLGLAGAQNTQLLVEPPWRPAVLWDWVTLTCQGSGTAGSTTWYKDGQHFGLQGHDRFKVNTKGNYWCDRPGTGLSPPINVSEDFLVLQVPARALLEGDMVTLHCRGWRNSTILSVSFYHEGKELGGLHNGTQLSLSLLQLNHSGRYSRKGQMDYWGWKESAPVTVTVKVHGEEVTAPNPTPPEPLHRYSGSAIPLPSPSLSSSQCQCWSVPPEPTEGSPLTLSCLSTPSPLRPRAPLLHVFYRNGQVVGGPQRSPQLLVPSVGVSHSGDYSCQVRSEGGTVRKSSSRRRVTVRMPVANATITPGVKEVPPKDTGTHRDTVATEVGGALLFLLLFVGVIVAWHQWHRVAARKKQERAPPDPPAPPEEGEVLYTHIVVTKRTGASPHATTLQDPQVIYAELRGPQGRPREPGDIYGNVL